MDMRRRNAQLLVVWVAVMVVSPLCSVLPRLVIHLLVLVVIAALAGLGSADILAMDPSGRPMLVQCQQQMAPVLVSVVHQLIASLAYEHLGRSGMLVTTAHPTWPAATLAPSAGVVAADRNRPHLDGRCPRALGSTRRPSLPPFHPPGGPDASSLG